MRIPFFSSKALATGFAALLLIALAGCQSSPTRSPPAPALEWLSSGPLNFPVECNSPGSIVVEFIVNETGLPGSIKASDGPTCAQQALMAWVETFRFVPPERATPSAIEWLMVSAKRGS